MDIEVQKELVKDYLEDATEFVDSYEGLLLQLEKSADMSQSQGIVSETLGILHTFKGNSGMMGYASIQNYVHNLEDLFKGIQKNHISIDEHTLDFLLNSANVIRQALLRLSPESSDDPDVSPHIQEIKEFMDDFSHSESDASNSEGVLTAGVVTSVASAEKSNVLKVDFTRLDELLNLVGELVIHRTRLGRIDQEIAEQMGEKGLALDLGTTTEQIGKVTTELQQAIMKVRMLPIRQVLMRFPRFVRDIARETGKKVNLHFEGEQTELDKSVIDQIGDPLLHLLKNAIDHGIEKPEVRTALEKPEEGNITIRSYQESNHIIIEVQDDGRGIDLHALRKKVVAENIMPQEEAEQKNEMDLVFLPGISTAQKVSEVSGRGIGMDEVKKGLNRINGIIEVDTLLNRGTCFTIKLPLTLAIISVLMVDVGAERYAIPLSAVVESIKIKREEIHEVNQRQVTQIRGRILPLVNLSELFDLPAASSLSECYVVVAKSAAGELGIIVDALCGQEEIVIKGLDEYVGNSPGIAGATILGDGKVILIVDIFDLVENIRTVT